MESTGEIRLKFWRLVDTTDGAQACWPWQGALSTRRYGILTISGKNVRAHRFALALKLGREPVGDARHLCHNPQCCNPSHLEEGTRKQNMQDSVKAGRTCKGARNVHAKLDDSKVLVIKQLLLHGVEHAKIAACYNVSRSVISHISLGKTWKHIS